MTPSKVTREICLFLKTVEDGTFYASTCEAIELALTQAISEERETIAKYLEDELVPIIGDDIKYTQNHYAAQVLRKMLPRFAKEIRKRGEVGDE